MMARLNLEQFSDTQLVIRDNQRLNRIIEDLMVLYAEIRAERFGEDLEAVLQDLAQIARKISHEIERNKR